MEEYKHTLTYTHAHDISNFCKLSTWRKYEDNMKPRISAIRVPPAPVWTIIIISKSWWSSYQKQIFRFFIVIFFVTFCSVVSWSYKGIFSTNFVKITRKTSWLQRCSFLLSSELANWFRVAVVPRLKFFLLFVIQFVSNDTCLKLTCFSLGTEAQLDRGKVSPALFQKLEKYALIWKKNSLIVVIYG